MTIAMQPIYTQTIGTNAPTSVVFNNIPQTFTDLKLEISLRTNNADSYGFGYLRFNGVSSGSATNLFGYATGVASQRSANDTQIPWSFWSSASTATANTYGSSTMYIPNYTGSNFKSTNVDAVTETNASSAYSVLQVFTAGLWPSTAAITSIALITATGSFAQHSTFTLYGITKG
jgi:hypothetical protein